MQKTKDRECENRALLSFPRLCAYLDCGRVTAERVATDAKARVEIGGRVLYSVAKIDQYLKTIEQ